uniref:F-box protein 15 n=1 Tax=Seriola lalandi dorsalis TaxID=1841481 RepID=A0A3B4X0C5_SERLL
MCFFMHVYTVSYSIAPYFLNQRLPSEILIKILSYLDASALFTVSHVNKLFYRLANNNALWNKIYIEEFGKKKKQKSKCMDELLLKMATVELQDTAAGYWKWLFFKTYMQKLQISVTSYSRNLHVTWELTVSEKSGHEGTLELSWSRFCETSVSLCWSGGRCLPSYQQISTLQLHGVRRIALSCPGLKKPGWRSLMAKLDMQTLTKSAQVIGQDRLVELKLLQPGIIVGTWRDQCSVAFIMFTLHFHRLVERSVQGSSVCPYMEPKVKSPFDDIDPEYGLHGYRLHIALHDTGCKLMSASFSQLFCRRTAQICDGFILLTAISRTNLSQHTPLSGCITLPWRCEALQGAVEVLMCSLLSATHTLFYNVLLEEKNACPRRPKYVADKW